MDIIEITKGEDDRIIIAANREGLAELQAILGNMRGRQPETVYYPVHTLVDHEGHDTKIAVWLRW